MSNNMSQSKPGRISTIPIGFIAVCNAVVSNHGGDDKINGNKLIEEWRFTSVEMLDYISNVKELCWRTEIKWNILEADLASLVYYDFVMIGELTKYATMIYDHKKASFIEIWEKKNIPIPVVSYEESEATGYIAVTKTKGFGICKNEDLIVINKDMTIKSLGYLRVKGNPRTYSLVL